jgi:antirestriction protein ArdC
MTAAEAVSFARLSVSNAMQIRASLTCDCEPYADVFTLRRWNAQGYRVRKGEHGIRISIVNGAADPEPGRILDDDETPTEAPRSRPKFTTAYVFCRCQVEPIRTEV